MTALDERPGLEPAGPSFEWYLGDLEEFGVRLHPDQQMLWDAVVGDGEEMMALAACAVESPTGYRMHPEPIWCWDELAQDERLIWSPQIITVRNDPEWWDFADRYYDRSEWRRFPSLMGTKEDMTSMLYSSEEPEPFRIWDLWPISGLACEEIVRSVESWYCDWYLRFMEWIACDYGESDPCDFAEQYGKPLEEHEHLDATGQRIVPDWRNAGETCKTGEKAYDDALEEFTIVVDTGERGSRYVRFPGEPQVAPGVLDIWHLLKASSRRNAWAAVNAYPEWEREAVLITERRYNQWLWSS